MTGWGEPGTQVRVVIDGEVLLVIESDLDPQLVVRTRAGARFALSPRDFAVQVVPVSAERPKLEQVLAKHAPRPTVYDPELACECDERLPDDAAFVAHLAEQLRAAGVAL